MAQIAGPQIPAAGSLTMEEGLSHELRALKLSEGQEETPDKTPEETPEATTEVSLEETPLETGALRCPEETSGDPSEGRLLFDGRHEI